MIILKTKQYGLLGDRARKAKGDYLDKIILQAKRNKLEKEEKQYITKKYRNNILQNIKNRKELLDSLPNGLNELPQETINKLYNKYQNIAKNNNVDIILDKTIPTGGRYASDELGDRVIINPLNTSNTAETLIHELEHIKQNKLNRPGPGLDYLNVINGKTHWQLLKDPKNVFKWMDRISREDDAINNTFKKLYLEKDIPLDYLNTRHKKDINYKLKLRAPLGDTIPSKNYGRD